MLRRDGARDRPLPGVKRKYTAAVCGDGRIMPIVETLGRRQLREIDPLSVEGRDLLMSGDVTLCTDDGARVETAPIGDVLARLRTTTQVRRNAYPELPRWTQHHDLLLRNIRRMQRAFKPRV